MRSVVTANAAAKPGVDSLEVQRPDPLNQPVGALLRPTEILQASDSINLAALELRECPFGALPVTSNGQMLGLVTEASIAQALSSGLPGHASLESIVEREATYISAFASGAEALRQFADTGVSRLVVLDKEGNYLGMLSPSDLLPKKLYRPRPSVIGGMATPFGVYLTTGSIGAGAGPLALVATGMLMFGLFLTGDVAAYYTTEALLRGDASDRTIWAVRNFMPLLVFFLGLRLLPLSGIHAAEHKVVHAIERGEELHPDVIRRMPRIHPRCGTNLAVGASLFLSIMFSKVITSEELRFLVAVFVTLICWKPIGNAVQWLITTKPPNDKQIQMGIRAGEELLEKYWMTRGAIPSPLKRIWNSGIFYVIAGSTACYGLARALLWILGLDVPV
jgi:CBS domain-containing protein